jgi:diguanylate cyclase (GGDEF)-like protein
VVTFVLISFIGIAIALVNSASGGPSSVFRITWVVVGLYVSIVGDLRMQFWAWTVFVSSFGWSMWENGERGGVWFVSTLIMASILGVLPFMVRVPVLGLIAVQRSRRALDKLTDIALDSDTVEEGMQRCLPLVESVMPVVHAAVLIRPRGKLNFQLLAATPAIAKSDERLPSKPGFSEALETGKCVFQSGYAFISVGETFRGNMVLVLELQPKMRSDLHFTVTAAMGEAIGASFLRLADHVASVTTLKDLSRTDALTGLANRRLLEERSVMEMAFAAEHGTALSVAMIDIDLFKNYNDSFGHLAGDVLLRHIADAMALRLRDTDFISRYGGEEFCVILSNTELQGAYELIDALRETVHMVSANIPVSVSGGVATWDGSEPFQSLVTRADWALYAAKTGGRDRVLCDAKSA